MEKFTVKTITDAEDMIISTLYDIGLEGAQIEDKVPLTPLEKEQMFVDILPDGPEDDGIAYLSFFVEESDANPVDANEVTASILRELDGLREFMEIGEGSVMVSETEDLDWINNWKQFFHQFYIDDLLVIPCGRRSVQRIRTRKSCISIREQHLAQECMRRRSFVSASSKSISHRRQSCLMWGQAAAFSRLSR